MYEHDIEKKKILFSMFPIQIIQKNKKQSCTFASKCKSKNEKRIHFPNQNANS
jgi:hypothetical protein